MLYISYNISTLQMFMPIKFTETSIDKMNKIHQKVIGLKFMFNVFT